MNGPAANNPFNTVLRDRAAALRLAYRGPIAPGCELLAISPVAESRVKRKTLISIPINAFTAGDNAIISTLIGRKLIYEIVLWNVTAQTLAFYQGASATGILLLRLTDFPALTGLTLGFNGNFDMPHMEVELGQPLILNLENSTQVDGFVRYVSA